MSRKTIGQIDDLEALSQKMLRQDYRESPAYVYSLFQDEINYGHIVQMEV